MSKEQDQVVDMLDVRLRRLHAGLDATEGFEQRVFRRVAEAERRAGRAPADLRAQFERRRQRTLRRLRLKAWLDGISACALVATGGLLAFRYLPVLSAGVPEVSGTVMVSTTLALVAAVTVAMLKRTGTRLR